MGFALYSAAPNFEEVPELRQDCLPLHDPPERENLWHRLRIRIRWWRKILTTRVRPAFSKR